MTPIAHRRSLAAALIGLTVLAGAWAADGSRGTQEPQEHQHDHGTPPDRAMPYPEHTDLVTTPSGLQYSILRAGSGRPAGRGARALIHFTAWTIDGREFDSTRHRAGSSLQPAPQEIGIGNPSARRRPRGVTEALEMMAPGDHFLLTVPPALGFPRGHAALRVPPNSVLVYEIEMLGVISRTLAWVRWADQLAQRSESGLQYRALAEGEGESCAEADLVYVEFAAWTLLGDLITSSGMLNNPWVMPPEDLPLPFLRELLPRMRAGSHFLLKVPHELAFGERPPFPLQPETKSIWQVRCIRAMRFEKPVFSLPAAEELEGTPSGLAYRVLREGTGRPPLPGRRVRLHHSLWLEDGTEIDSSYSRPTDSSWLVGHRKPVVPGTPEGLLLMREGAIFQFLVPAELAYGEQGFPAMDIPPDADLVYVVELVRAQ